MSGHHLLLSVVDLGSEELVGGGTVTGILVTMFLFYTKWIHPFMETRKANVDATVQQIMGQRQGLVDAVGTPVGNTSLTENVDKMVASVGDLTSTVKELDTKIDSISREMSGLDAKVDGLGREISHMRERASDQQNVIASLIHKDR